MTTATLLKALATAKATAQQKTLVTMLTGDPLDVHDALISKFGKDAVEKGMK